MRFFLLFPLVLYCAACPGQQVTADSLQYSVAEKNARILYQRFTDPSARLYNGPEYVDYSYQLKKGDPFFECTEFTPGNIVYDGLFYENVPMLYDLVKQEIVIHDPFNTYQLSLITERVASFTFMNHSFVRLVQNDSNQAAISTGLYEVLYNGNTAVYKKQKKTIQEETQQDGVMRYIEETNAWFIRKEQKIYAAGSKSAMLSVFRNRKSEMQQFMQKNKLNFRKDKAGTLIKVAAYYDEINK